MPKGHPKQPKASATNGQNDKTITKMDAVRAAQAKLGQGAKPSEIRGFVQDKFGMDLDAKTISNYKTYLSKRAASQSAVIRPSSGTAVNAVPAAGGAGNVITLEDVRALKELTERIGADNLRQLAEVLSR